MNKYATVIGIAFILVTVLSSITLALTVDMYGAFTETQNKITPWEGNVRIEEVRIPPIHGMGESVRVTILVNVSNPTRLDIWVYNIEFSLFMFNRSTAEFIGNFQTMEQFYVLAGGSSDYTDSAFTIPAGSYSVLESSLTVSTSVKLAILNTTDPIDGKYRPYVDADLRYEAVDLGILVPVHGIFYWNQDGVDPYVG
jgi:hypothetical protein